ncbi:hypothetical protein NPS01_14820 [Nocardioides psychrotolerans]|uniref:Uncharacterized protein n=1 Tax=Nocardioides psychrotolerans TaxID=1005945 RepID=A0A1I3F7K4_9ACTN|nr:hypothetical protein [Nocardioides psychrotolerans]GEP37819.1 hypothetical protein NPS01_14820 [Nocardioides psychrotolerans]SFI07140.1 hypothetical protein SAMN05216561_104259 [Nocardioides psychrotolerans]
MSESENEPEIGIGDDQLPEDLQPGEDNPLAEGLDDGETVDDLLTDGKSAEESPDASPDASADDGEESDGSQHN